MPHYPIIYRGTEAELMADTATDQAWNYFRDEALNALRERIEGREGATDATRLLKIATEGLPESPNVLWRDGWNGMAAATMFIVRVSHREGCKYVFEVDAGAIYRARKTDIVLRKNGTVNSESLGEAIYTWAYKRLDREERQAIYAENVRIYDAAGRPLSNDEQWHVDLAVGRVGAACLRFNYSDTFHVRIEDIRTVAAQVEAMWEMKREWRQAYNALPTRVET